MFTRLEEEQRPERFGGGVFTAAIHPIGLNVLNAYLGKGKSYAQL